jgi:hypothetical protein
MESNLPADEREPLWFSRNDLPPDSLMRWFRKRTLTRAVRIAGAFEVETREGTLRCPDGWLALDAHGWPYPIAADEFERIYEPAERANYDLRNEPARYDARNEPEPTSAVLGIDPLDPYSPR